MRCCVEEEAEAPAPDLVEKEQAVAWSTPYFIPGGSNFAPGEQPLISVRGITAPFHVLHLCSVPQKNFEYLPPLLLF